MSRLARWCLRRRRLVLALWLLLLVAALGAARAAGSDYDSSLSLPGTDSQAAVTLLTQDFPAAAGESDSIVVATSGGASVLDPGVRKSVTAAFGKVAALPHIASVTSPYTAAGAGQISRDGTVAFARVTWDLQPADITTADVQTLIQTAETAGRADVHVSLGGASITASERAKPGPSVAVGVVAALAVLLIVFGGALLPAVLPLVGAAFALVAGSAAISLLSHVLTVAGESTDLAVLIGLGVGVDYGLFIVSRHRAAVKRGRSFEDAVAEAANTSGRTVLFAGLTVVVALLGQFALGVGFLDGLSAAAAVTVLLTIAAALTLLPALLGFLGPKTLSRRERHALTLGPAAGGPVNGTRRTERSARWARFIENHRAAAAIGSIVVVAVVALPVLGLRLGTSDSSTDPASWTSRQSYDALSRGFGPGFNGPLELAGQISGPGDLAAFNRLLAGAAREPGVAAVTAARTSPSGDAVVATVFPAAGPQDQSTVTLVDELRGTLIPQAARESTLSVHVGGQTASAIDFSHVLGSKFPLFVAVVVLLAFVLLAAVFRSLLIPLLASVLNLLSVAAALGALTAVFTKGWGAGLIGLSGTGPVDAFLPVVMFSVLFGLSMDYEVYTVGRMHEQWRRLNRADAPHPDESEDEDPHLARRRAIWLNHRAVASGQARSTGIVAAAAGIMILVFGSFLIGRHHLLQEFGFGLGFSVLIDALILRSVLLPAVMHLAGPANWVLPARLQRLLPRLDFEADPDPDPGAGAGAVPGAGDGSESGAGGADLSASDNSAPRVHTPTPAGPPRE
ncbi:MAG TPA: MMPL family transporter [Actinocrinis sp.]|jgi:RND superfamily putative drug exporter